MNNAEFKAVYSNDILSTGMFEFIRIIFSLSRWRMFKYMACLWRGWILIIDTDVYSASMIHRPNAGLMFVHRLRRCPNINPALDYHLVFDGQDSRPVQSRLH